MVINTNTHAMAAASNLDSSQTITTDFTAPTFSAISVSPSVAKSGTTVTISFTSSESLSGTPTVTIGAARTFHLAGYSLTDAVAGKPARLSFTVDQPSGAPLTAYRTGPGPHTGVHVILVRQDLGAIVHHHPPVAADGR